MTNQESNISERNESLQTGRVKMAARLVWRTLLAPFRAFLAVRKAMTPASVSLLLFGIITLNIIWGFPWTGIFSACVSMFAAGCLIHFITFPKLETSFTVPNSAAKGQAFPVTIHVRNQSVLPALDFGFDFANPAPKKRRWFQRKAKSTNLPTIQQTPTRHQILAAGEMANLNAMITYHRRGIHALPDTAVNGSFPFHLFESSFKKASLTSIAITPAPLAGDDAHSRELLNNLGGWSHKLLSGDQLDYTGSREYEVGMAVRRWDFPSWARLGIPIVREYQSPSVQKVFLIIDTTLDDNAWHDDSDEHPLLERMLSLATTAIHELTKQTVKIQFFLTTPSGHSANSGVFLTDADHESLLIQLAAAAPVKGEQGDRQINEALEIAGRSPTLVLTTRNTLKMSERLSRTCTVIRTDPPFRTDAPETPRPNAVTRRARGKQSKKSPADSQSNPESMQQGSSTNASP